MQLKAKLCRGLCLCLDLFDFCFFSLRVKDPTGHLPCWKLSDGDVSEEAEWLVFEDFVARGCPTAGAGLRRVAVLLLTAQVFEM